MNVFNHIGKIIGSENRFISLLRVWLILCAITLIAQPAARLTWNIVGHNPSFKTIAKTIPHPQVRSKINLPVPKDQSAAIAPLFGTPIPPTQISPPKEQTKDLPQTTLNLILKGIISSSNHPNGLAVISEKSGKKEDGLYGIDDEVLGIAKVKEIDKDRVVLARDGKLEVLFLKEADSKEGRLSTKSSTAQLNGITGQGDGKRWQLNKKYFNQQLADIPTLAKEIGLSVYRKGKKQQGYSLVSRKGSPLLQKLGLKPGDVLLEVNGIKLVNAHQGLTAYQQLRSSSQISLVIKRKGVKKDLIYSIN